MKTIAATYTYHENLSSPESLKSVAYFDVEDDVAADILEVEKPFGFVAVKSTHQSHIAMIVYWIAAAHNRYLLESDRILDVTEA